MRDNSKKNNKNLQLLLHITKRYPAKPKIFHIIKTPYIQLGNLRKLRVGLDKTSEMQQVKKLESSVMIAPLLPFPSLGD